MTKQEIAEKIARVQSEIDLADSDLRQAVSALHVAPRAEKTMLTPLLEAAFNRLRVAKGQLAELQQSLLASL